MPADPTKLVVVYHAEVDGGDLPHEALAEYLFNADKRSSDWSLWEIAGNSMELQSVAVLKEN